MTRGGMLAGFLGLADPVHRRWLLGRLRNRWPAGTDPAIPAYRGAIPVAETPGRNGLADLVPPKAVTVLLTLPGGEALRVVPGKADGVIERPWSDPAAMAAFHGFAWLSQDPDGVALATLWPAWLDRYAPPTPANPAWQADIAAERALALLDIARRRGLPQPGERTLAALGDHARVLLGSFAHPEADPAATLRRAQALVRLGLALAMPATAAFGFGALLSEAGRLLMPSGVANLDSTHHHLRVCQSLADAWLAAQRHDRTEAPAVEALLRRALAVVPLLTLPGGFPLIGDVVDSLPPKWLAGLLRGAPMDQGWTGRLPPEEQAKIAELRESCLQDDLEALRIDGWLRVDLGRWRGLWHMACDGWPAADGHGHQDLGAAELHFDTVALFVDPGGGRLDTASCRRASAHGGLQFNRHDPLPFARAGYSQDFRRQVGGQPPRQRAEFDGVSLAFGKLMGAPGLREGRRRWRFDGDGLTVDEALNGTGRVLVTRRFLTPLAVHREDPKTVRLEGSGKRFRLSADQPVTVTDGCRWRGHGVTEPLKIIEVGGPVNLPWRGGIRLSVCQDPA